MSPGVFAQVKAEWRAYYQRPGLLMAGVVQSISPSGAVARIAFGGRVFSNIPLDHLEPASFSRL